ncbi:MAG TPA: uracil-DNA glycosylase [Acidimicrobiales bacterium]|nr:uracil-DNA glycosylase [Acidimicrobiales bacterium]
MDLAALASCTRCPLAQTRQRVVIGSGPRHATLMIVGEAPGATEDAGGEPFIGRSGQLLFRLLNEEAGLSRDQCFVTNVVKCRPPANRVPRRGEIRACRPWLDEQLAEVSPRVLLALGATAAANLFATTAPMGEVHGVIHELAGRRGLATYHPAAALRGGPRVLALVREDLRRVRALLEAT